MIKLQINQNLLYQKPKIIRQSLSLKNSIISFPTENNNSPKLSFQSFINKKINSPSKQTSQKLKIKIQRQRYIDNYQEISSNQSYLISSHVIKNPQNFMQRSNSYKISSSERFKNLISSPNQKTGRNNSSKTARTQQAQIGFQYPDTPKQANLKDKKQSQTRNKINLFKKINYDLNNFTLKNSKDNTFTCKSVKKCSQIEFYKQQLSTLVIKKSGLKQKTQEQGLSDETCFNVVLQKIKQKNKSEASQQNFLKGKQKFIEKTINSGLYSPNKRQNSNLIIGQLAENRNNNIFKSLQLKKTLNFKSALEWSNHKVNLMKSPLFMKKQKKKGGNMAIKYKNNFQDQIQGWVK